MAECEDIKQVRERVETQLNVSPKHVKVEPNEFNVAKGHDGKQAEEKSIASNNDGKLTRSLERALKQLLPTVSPTVPLKTTQYDAKELFDDAPYLASIGSSPVPYYSSIGSSLVPYYSSIRSSLVVVPYSSRSIALGHGNPPRCSKEIVLRTSEEIQQGSAIELPKFDPNFFSLDQVHCRYTNCPETKARNPNHSSKTNKEDLYLCPNHRKDMVDVVTKKCSEKGITVNFKDSKIEDLNGYTSLIGLTEKAFIHFKEKCSQVSSSEVNGFLPEIFLNVRNFFIITNTVLNPDFENLISALWAVLTMLQLLLKQCDDPKSVENLHQLLREIMEIILRFFNVVYEWVVLPLQRNPGAQIGAGLGCAVGAVAAGAAFGPALPVIGFGAVIGAVAGGLIGGGIYNQKRDNCDQRRYTYEFTGNRDGSLSMQVLSS